MGDKKPAGPTAGEVAVSRGGRDITMGYLDPLMVRPPTDAVLQARGADHAIYEQILGDDQVASTLQQRRMAVLSKEWRVDPGAEDRASVAAADFLRESLQELGWDNITGKMLMGVYYGYAVAECLWGRDGRFITLDQIKVRKQRRFAFGVDGDLRLLTMDNPTYGERMPERKFWHFRTGADNDDEPYGIGLAHWLYWPVTFKRGGMRSWLAFLDKFGIPTAMGSYPPNATTAEKTRLLDAITAIQNHAGIIVPEGMRVELIEAARSGTATYEVLLDRMNAAIAKVVLSQTLTTENIGGQFKADVQQDVRNEVIESDSALVDESFNRSVARWLTAWNFPGATPPIVLREVEDPEDANARSERDERLFRIGYRPTLKEVQRIYGPDYEPVSDTAASPPAAPDGEAGKAAFAEAAARDTADELFEALAAATLQEQAAGMLAPLLERLRQGLDPAEADAELAALYPRMDDHAFEVLLARMIFLADTLGRLEAEDDGRDD